MRVIIWGINYAPEPTGIAPYTTELANHLQSRGVEVEVVTGFSYYPEWKKQPRDSRQGWRSEELNGVKVHRCWQYVPRRLTTLKRILHEFSFGMTSLWRALVLPRADLYVVISPPLGLGLIAWLVTRLKRSRYLFHVQDLQPDSAAGLGMMRPGLFLRLMYACERLAYRGAAGVSGISHGMVEAFAGKDVPAGKIFLLPNWLRQPREELVDNRDATKFRQLHGISADAFLAVYSGNLGRKQGLGVLLDAADILAKENDAGRAVVMVIAGNGADQVLLAQRLEQHPLANLRLLPLLPEADYRSMLSAADVALVTQMPGTGQVCFPSKLLSVLSAGLPVITTADETSDLARAVRDGAFGRNVPAAKPALLAAALREAAAQPETLRGWRKNTCWVNQFSPEGMLARFENAIRTLAAPDAESPPELGRVQHRMNSP